ncbi:MAG: bifunctional oligoribonuclease/PAP phosphatase NrnA [Thermodesulfobacteriota bacterium]
MINKIAEILRNGDDFLVVTHVNPDGDAIGSLLGMRLALEEMGKRSWALVGEQPPSQYDFLGARTKVITDPRSVNGTPSWIIALDCADQGRISADLGRFRPPCRLINIDHHVTNPLYGELHLVETGASCSAELAFRVLKQAGYTLSRTVGKCLYTGLITDTGGFRYPGVNSRTFQVASELLEPGIDSYDVSRHLYEEYPLSRFQLEALMLDRMEMMHQGTLVVSVLYLDDFRRLNVDTSETENLVNRLREIRGVEAGVLITQVSEQLTRVSLRSKGQLNVALIAKGFGGGGHPRAAGFKSLEPPEAIKNQVIQAVGEAWATPDTVRVDPPGLSD